MFGDLYVLLLAMNLLCQAPENNHIVNENYTHVKRCLFAIETQGFLSLRILQTHLLLGLYELGHSIQPAAYLTTGHCVQIGNALGLKELKSGMRLVQLPRVYLGRFMDFTNDYQDHGLALKNIAVHGMV